MCGIWGVVGAADEHMAQRAAQAIRHRGPDDYGTFVATEPEPVSLVNARLAIIDLSEAGHQPMCNEDRSMWIVYNGETYNYQPLREELLELGHRFNSHSDTEVILHAYEEWGAACLDRLRGMFAFAIWDMKEAKLFVARDRLGIKPVYYAHHEGQSLMFGSELKALLSSGLIEARLNYLALHHYLSFYAVPTPYTMLDGIQSLPPGHYMTYHKRRLNIRQYWSLPAIEPLQMDKGDILENLRALLEESIRLRMIADVPVGAFLSGGIDSSAVVALMTRISGERLRTFSIGFGLEGEGIDERSDARVLADHYDTEHTEVIVSGRDVCDQLDQIIRSMDQPSGDGLNTYLVSQATAQSVKVAVSGLGGDELFAGYPQFRMLRQVDRLDKVWKAVPSFAQSMVRSLGKTVGPLDKALTWLDGDLLDRYERVRILFNEGQKLALYSPALSGPMAAPESSIKYLNRFVHPVESKPVAQVTRLELHNYMAPTLLRDTDAMSMAHSLEVRVPLIDHKLVEFAVRIPAKFKLRHGRSKWIFVEALRDVLPDAVMKRPKRGFEMPVAAWMRHELRPVLDDVFSRESVEKRGLFRYEQVRAVYDNFQETNAPYMHAWALAVLELWLRQFVD